VSHIEQIRRSHASAKPNPVENPAWFYTHMDLGTVLESHDRLLHALNGFVRHLGHGDADDGLMISERIEIAETAIAQAK
jgi:hypothetical protein